MMSTPASLALQTKETTAFFESGKSEVAARSRWWRYASAQPPGSSAPGGGGTPPPPQLPWSTVRGIARYAPSDSKLPTLHDPLLLAAVAKAEGEERALRLSAAPAAQQPVHRCFKCSQKGLLSCSCCHVAR
jgi:hypothetical protein